MAQDRILHQVTLARRALETALQQLIQHAQAVAWGRAGVNRTPRLTELLCWELRVGQTLPLLTTPAVVLTLGAEGSLWLPEPQGLRRWRAQHPPTGPVALLTLEQSPHRGTLTVRWFSPEGESALVHSVKIVGPGMHRVVTTAGQAEVPDLNLAPPERERWSRLIGALGEAPWQRLRSLHYALIGVGRTGSLMATSLTRLGVRHLTLIDPDRLEWPNLDAMDGVTGRDVGHPKVTGVSEAIRALSDMPLETQILPNSITTLQALGAAKEAEVLIACVDHDGARVATGIIATLYARPLLDIGTGVLGSGSDQQMGADVRLILPGERCLWCLGGVANREQVRTLLAVQHFPSLAGRQWPEERAGSLRSLNQLAAHLGLRLLEDLVRERVQHSTWLHLEYDAQGVPVLHTVTPPENPGCPLCHLTAEGDAGLANVRDVLQDLTAGSQG